MRCAGARMSWSPRCLSYGAQWYDYPEPPVQPAIPPLNQAIRQQRKETSMAPSARITHSLDSRHSLLDLVGYTPLVQLTRITLELPAAVRVYTKAECYNPGGSVKDRPV